MPVRAEAGADWPQDPRRKTGLGGRTAREVALKLKETCRVAAEALTATDLAHGPVAALDELFPVWVIASDDPMLPSVKTAVARARESAALIVASGSAADRIEGAAYVLRTPSAPLPLLSPLLSVLPGQLFASVLAQAKGLDPGPARPPEQGHAGALMAAQRIAIVGAGQIGRKERRPRQGLRMWLSAPDGPPDGPDAAADPPSRQSSSRVLGDPGSRSTGCAARPRRGRLRGRLRRPRLRVLSMPAAKPKQASGASPMAGLVSE